MVEGSRSVDDILEEINYENEKNEYLVSLNDLEILVHNGAEILELNKTVGNCYCHIVHYQDKKFFTPTGARRTLNDGKFYQEKDYEKQGC